MILKDEMKTKQVGGSPHLGSQSFPKQTAEKCSHSPATSWVRSGDPVFYSPFWGFGPEDSSFKNFPFVFKQFQILSFVWGIFICNTQGASTSLLPEACSLWDPRLLAQPWAVPSGLPMGPDHRTVSFCSVEEVILSWYEGKMNLCKTTRIFPTTFLTQTDLCLREIT